MTQQGPPPPPTQMGHQEHGTCFYAQAMGPKNADGSRAPLGEYPAATLPEAIDQLDQLDCFGYVEMWTSQTEARQIVARRLDNGEWWTYSVKDGWELMPGRTPVPVGPALVLVLTPVPEDVALAAAEKGHLMVTAEQGGLSRVERWNCAACGRVALRRDGGPLYGTAITEHCTPNTEEAQP